MQDRYVIFTSDTQGLETYLGSGENAKRVDLRTRSTQSTQWIYYSLVEWNHTEAPINYLKKHMFMLHVDFKSII